MVMPKAKYAIIVAHASSLWVLCVLLDSQKPVSSKKGFAVYQSRYTGQCPSLQHLPNPLADCVLQLRQDVEKRDAKDKEKERQEAVEERRMAKRLEEQVPSA